VRRRDSSWPTMDSPNISARSYSPSTVHKTPTTTTNKSSSSSHRKVPRSPHRSLSPAKRRSSRQSSPQRAAVGSPGSEGVEYRDPPAALLKAIESHSNSLRDLHNSSPSMLPISASKQSHSRSSTPTKLLPASNSHSRPSTPLLTPSNSNTNSIEGAPSSSSRNKETPPSHSQTTPSSTASQSYLNRKAHKFNSLKKKKQAAAVSSGGASYGSPSLLNKLFCHSLSDMRDDQDTADDMQQTEKAAGEASAGITQGSEKKAPVRDDDTDTQGCMSIAFTQAAEALQLNSEKTVRRNIQKSVNQVVEATHRIQDEMAANCTDLQSDVQMQCGEGAVSIFGTKPQHPAREISQKREMESLNNVLTMDSQEEVERRAARQNVVEDLIQSSEKGAKDVRKQLSPSKQATTLPSKQSESPNTLLFVTETEEDLHANFDYKEDDDSETKEIAPVTTTLVSVRSPVTSPCSYDGPHDERTFYKKNPLASPSPPSFKEVQMTALSPASDQFDDDDFLPDDFKTTASSNVMALVNNVMNSLSPMSNRDRDEHLETFAWEELQEKIATAVAVARDEWESSATETWLQQHNAKLEAAVQESQRQAKETLQSREEQLKADHATETNILTETYHKKITELTEQTNLAKQLAKQRQKEIEDMEAEMHTLREAVSKETGREVKTDQSSLSNESLMEDLASERKTIQDLKVKARRDLLALEKEKDEQVDKLNREISALEDIKRKLEIELTETKHNIEFQLGEELELVKNDLVSAQHSLKDTRFELDKCLEKLADRDLQLAKLKNEMETTTIELAACKRTLHDKKEQIESLRSQLDDSANTSIDYPLKVEQLQELVNDRQMRIEILTREAVKKEAELDAAKQRLAEKQSEIDILEHNAKVTPSKTPRGESVQLQSSLRSGLKASSSEDSQNSRSSGITPPRKSILSSPSPGSAIKLRGQQERIVSLEKELTDVRSKLADAETALYSLRGAETAVESETLPTDDADGLNLLLQQRIEKRFMSVKTEIERNYNGQMDDKDMLIDELKRQLELVEGRLVEKERELAVKDGEILSIMQSTDDAVRSEVLARAQLQMTNIRKEIEEFNAEKEREGAGLRQRMKVVQDSLTEKEAELSALKAQTLHIKQSGSFSSQLSSPSSQSRSSKPPTTPADHTIESLRGSIELHEREKEALREQIGVLEEQISVLTRGHEQALGDLRRASEQELIEVKRDMEMRVEKHMQAQRELKYTLLTVDSADKEELMDKIEQLESAKKTERSGGLREVQKKEELLQRISLLEKQERQMCDEHEFNLQQVRQESENEIHRLRKEIEKTRIESRERERELQQVISATASFEKEEFMQTIDNLEAMLESERNCTTLIKLKVASLEKDAKHIAQSHRDELLEQRNRLEAEVDHFRRQLHELTGIEDAMQKTSNDRDKLEEELRQTKEALEQCQSDYHAQFERMRASHLKEVNQIKLEMDDEIEKTENAAMESIEELEQRIKELEDGASNSKTAQIEDLEKRLADKEKVLVSLGDQLAETKTQCKKLEQSMAIMSDELQQSKEKAGKATDELQSVVAELAMLRKTHEEFEAVKEAACDDARQEMVARAEIQFKQANQLYIKLKKQYDLCKQKVENLEKELKTTKGRLEKAETVELNLKEEVAELQVSKTKTEADAAKKGKEYRREMERLLKVAADFEKKLKEAEVSNRQNMTKLSSATSAKERLQHEYDEMKNVCEELMTMVESQQQVG
jgi:uncharacterized coiled-coil protein SlyX